ncbi:hypothetical protein DFH06DRAFT_56052 [Mycena polygramma]|nr:hypothetical protein DFH06DRAFT_56052 [Mycena polygramma]
MLAFDDADRKVGSIGALLRNVEAPIVHDEEGTVEAAEGAPGELWVRGKTIMKVRTNPSMFNFSSLRDYSGILEQPAYHSRRDKADGWLKTGDIVTKDRDGFYWVVDRSPSLLH